MSRSSSRRQPAAQATASPTAPTSKAAIASIPYSEWLRSLWAVAPSADMQEPGDDRGNPADDKPLGAKEGCCALQRVSDIDSLGLDRPFLFPQTTEAGTGGACQRE